MPDPRPLDVRDLSTLPTDQPAQLGQALDLKTSRLGRASFDPLVGVVFVPNNSFGPGFPLSRIELSREEAAERLRAVRHIAQSGHPLAMEEGCQQTVLADGRAVAFYEQVQPARDLSKGTGYEVEVRIPPGGFTTPDAPAQPKVVHFGDWFDRVTVQLGEPGKEHQPGRQSIGGFKVTHASLNRDGSIGLGGYVSRSGESAQPKVEALDEPQPAPVSDTLQTVLSHLGLSKRYAEIYLANAKASDPEVVTAIETIREAMSLGASFRRVLDVLPEQIQAALERAPEAINAVARLVEEKGGQPVYQDPRVAKLQARVKELEARVQELETGKHVNGHRADPAGTDARKNDARKNWEFGKNEEFGVIDDEGDTGWRRVTKVGTFFAWDPPSAEDGAGWSFWAFDTDEELDDQLAFEKGLKDAQAAMEAAEVRAPELIRTAAITLAEQGAFGLPGWIWDHDAECWILYAGLAIRGRALPGGIYYVVEVLGRGVDHPEGFQEGRMTSGKAKDALDAMEVVSGKLYGLGATLPIELENVLFGRTRLGD